MEIEQSKLKKKKEKEEQERIRQQEDADRFKRQAENIGNASPRKMVHKNED
jgi:hypothetical protein